MRKTNTDLFTDDEIDYPGCDCISSLSSKYFGQSGEVPLLTMMSSNRKTKEMLSDENHVCGILFPHAYRQQDRRNSR